MYWPMPVLDPIDKPNFIMRVVYRIARRQYGKVLTPLRVIYSRSPVLLTVGLLIEWIRAHALRLEPELVLLVGARVSAHHGCDFCRDLGTALAIRQGIGAERFNDLARWRDSTAFSPRERAALAWVDDILHHGRLDPATVAEARRFFSERELVDLTWMQASETYFNVQAHPLEIPSDGLAAIAPRASR
jgi:AhpD family alkylhydroperoxidase